MRGVRHTRYGWWLEEAQGVTRVDPAPTLERDEVADVVVVGGGYLGLWTAWQIKQLEPDADVVVLEGGIAGHGPSGRNGGFVSTLWDDLPILRERAGDAAALAVCRASEAAVTGIGEWCEGAEVDAWYRFAPQLDVATTEAQLGAWDEFVTACREVGAPEEGIALTAGEVRTHCDSPSSSAERCGRKRRLSIQRGSRWGCGPRCRSAASASTSARACAASRATALPRRRVGRCGRKASYSP